ncbi:MAG TPA: hypothetical protein VJU53_07515 [Burkholderiaceae bacterium]|nr:hypothetical protein [Burkholderiaceae bacterium]
MTSNMKGLVGTPHSIARWIPESGMRDQSQTLPKNAQRRIKRVGIAATSVAATMWLVGAAWAWQFIG